MPPPPAHPGIPRLRSPAPCGTSPSRLPRGPSHFWGGSALPPAARCPSHRTTTVHTTLYQHDSTAHTTTPRSRTTKTAWQWDVPRGHHAVGQGEAGGGEQGRCKQGGLFSYSWCGCPSTTMVSPYLRHRRGFWGGLCARASHLQCPMARIAQPARAGAAGCVWKSQDPFPSSPSWGEEPPLCPGAAPAALPASPHQQPCTPCLQSWGAGD